VISCHMIGCHNGGLKCTIICITVSCNSVEVHRCIGGNVSPPSSGPKSERSKNPTIGGKKGDVENVLCCLWTWRYSPEVPNLSVWSLYCVTDKKSHHNAAILGEERVLQLVCYVLT
jgi:hypothetical protein